jgi:hypothetical protein
MTSDVEHPVLRLVVAPPAEPVRGGGTRLDVERGADPNRTWVEAGEYWYAGMPAAQAAQWGAFTVQGARATLPCRPPGAVPPDLFGWVAPTWRNVRSACGARLPGAVPLRVVAPGTPLRRWERVLALGRAPERALVFARFTDTEIDATSVDGCARCRLVLSEGSDAGWEARVNGAEIASDATASTPFNEWPVELARGSAIALTYRPARIAYGLELLSAFAWAVVAAAAIASAVAPAATVPAES